MRRRYFAIVAVSLVPAALTLAGGCSDDDPSCHDENGCPTTHGAGGHGEGGSGATGSNTGGDGTGATGVGGTGGQGVSEGGAGGSGGT